MCNLTHSEAFDTAIGLCTNEEEKTPIVARKTAVLAEKRLDDERQKQAFGRLFDKEVYADKPIPVVVKKQTDDHPSNDRPNRRRDGSLVYERDDGVQEEDEAAEDDGVGLLQGMWNTFTETCCCKKHKEG